MGHRQYRWPIGLCTCSAFAYKEHSCCRAWAYIYSQAHIRVWFCCHTCHAGQCPNSLKQLAALASSFLLPPWRAIACVYALFFQSRSNPVAASRDRWMDITRQYYLYWRKKIEKEYWTARSEWKVPPLTYKFPMLITTLDHTGSVKEDDASG